MIRHKKVKMLALVLTFVMLFATAASAASIPNDSVIIGDKGFSIGFLTNPAKAAEIQTALDNLGAGPLVYQIEGLTTGWTSIMTGIPLTAVEVAAFPAITYKDDNGVITNYPAGGGGATPTFTMAVNNGLTPGKKMVIVTLDTANPENYIVAVAGTQLTYNAAQKKFGGEVDEADAVQSKVVVTEKVVEPTPTFTMTVNSGLVPGKSIVIVTLDTTNPENYNVAVAGTPLTYNTKAKKFAGEVDTTDAVQSKVVVTSK